MLSGVSERKAKEDGRFTVHFEDRCSDSVLRIVQGARESPASVLGSMRDEKDGDQSRRSRAQEV